MGKHTKVSSAALLRRAVTRIYDWWHPYGDGLPHIATADFLEFVATAREQIDMVGDGTASVMFVDIEDHATAIARAYLGSDA